MPKNFAFRLMLVPLAAAALHAAGPNPAPGLNRFALDSYRALARGEGNLIFSPFNIAASLSMALAGARGETASEMARTLGQPQANPGYSAALASLTRRLTEQGNANGNQLLTANNVWLQSGFAVLPEFRRAMDVFQAPFAQLDFSNGEQARRRINRWTEEQTKNRISELLPPGSLSPDTRLALSSAIYFLGKWESAFRPSNTRPHEFRPENGPPLKTSFMRQTAKFGYAAAPGVRILEMRYRGTPLAFDILLPESPGGLAGLEQSLTVENLSGWLGGIRERTIDVRMPKFRAESEFSLRDALSSMGMQKAFTSSADFSGIDGRRDLCLSRVAHKAFVEVSEEGTEAAAATASTVTLISMAQPLAFLADRPFVFLIRDTESGAILFAGRLLNPR